MNLTLKNVNKAVEALKANNKVEPTGFLMPKHLIPFAKELGIEVDEKFECGWGRLPNEHL